MPWYCMQLSHPNPTLDWLFFDLNSYFASVEQQENPDLVGRPVAVVPMMSDATCAIAASYEAKAYGIKTGTKIYEAKRLCPDLHCVLARHDVYVDYHHRILKELERHLHIDKVCSIDEAACRLMGAERERNNAIALAHQIKQGLHDRIGACIRCSIGIAPNAFLAKIATDMQKPDGLTVLEADSFHERLFQLKLTDLTGIGQNMQRRLNRAGVYTIKDFWDLPPKHARQIWGSVGGERFWYKLHGYDIALDGDSSHKSVVGHSRVLDPHLRNPDAAYSIAKQLTVKAVTRLRRYGLYASRFSLQMRGRDRQRWAGEMHFMAMQDHAAFVKILSQLWAHMQRETQSDFIRKIAISIYDLQAPEQVTMDLFSYDSPKQASNRNLSTAIDRINKRYGPSSVTIGTLAQTSAGHVGTKIAFNRIPEQIEFTE